MHEQNASLRSGARSQQRSRAIPAYTAHRRAAPSSDPPPPRISANTIFRQGLEPVPHRSQLDVSSPTGTGSSAGGGYFPAFREIVRQLTNPHRGDGSLMPRTIEFDGARRAGSRSG